MRPAIIKTTKQGKQKIKSNKNLHQKLYTLKNTTKKNKVKIE